MGSVDMSGQEQVAHVKDDALDLPTSTTDPNPLADPRPSKRGWAFPSLAIPAQSSPVVSSSSTRPSDTRLPPTPPASKFSKPTPSKSSRPLPVALSLAPSPLKSEDRSKRKKPKLSSLLDSPSGLGRSAVPSRIVPPTFSSASSRSRNGQPLPTHASPSARTSSADTLTKLAEASSHMNHELHISPFKPVSHKSKRQSNQEQGTGRSLMSGLMGPGLLAERSASKELSVRDILLGKSPSRGKVPHGLLFSNASLLLSSRQSSMSKFYTALHKSMLSNPHSLPKYDVCLTVRSVICSSLSPHRVILETCTTDATLTESTEDQRRWVILDGTAPEISVARNTSNWSALQEGSTILGFRPFGEIEWDGLEGLVRGQEVEQNPKILLIDRFLIT